MKAVKGNKQYTIEESQKKAYEDAGFDIYDDTGEQIAWGRGRSVPYEDHMRAVHEIMDLQALAAARYAENEELKKTNISLWAREDITEKMLFNCNHRLQSYKQALEKIEDLATSGYLKDSRFCEAKELQQILTIINEELKEE